MRGLKSISRATNDPICPPKDNRHGTDPKADVMDSIGRLVADGIAELSRLANGDIELRFRSGEVFHLVGMAITRVC